MASMNMVIRHDSGKLYAVTSWRLESEPKERELWYLIHNDVHAFPEIFNGERATYAQGVVSVRTNAPGGLGNYLRFELPADRPAAFIREVDIPAPAGCRLPLRWNRAIWEKYSKKSGWLPA